MLALSFLNILLIALATTLGGMASEPSQTPAPTAQPQAEQAEPESTETVEPQLDADRLLTELETADQGMRDLRARIVYDRIDATLGDRQYRHGELLFRDRTPEGQANRVGMRSFVVRFEKYSDLDVQRALNESWAFDGRWLIERNDDDKTYRKREITRAGQEVDPLRLGEGPLPIPIGQRKADILARYEVELVDPLDSLQPAVEGNRPNPYAGYVAWVNETKAVQLKLTPLRKEDGEFDSVRLWYWKSSDDPDRWLPLLARAGRNNARGREVDTAFVLMNRVKVNDGVTEEEMTVPEPGSGYTVQIDRLPAEGSE